MTGKTEEEVRAFFEDAFSEYVDFSAEYSFSITEWKFYDYDCYFCKWDGQEQDIYFVASGYVFNTLFLFPASPAPDLKATDIEAVIDAYLADLFPSDRNFPGPLKSYEILGTEKLRYRDTDCLFVKLLVYYGDSSVTQTEFLLYPAK